MNLRQRSKIIYSSFLLAALLVITLGISVIEKLAIERQIEHLVPEFRRSLVQGDNRAVREIIRNTLRYPILGIEVKRFDGIVVDSQSSKDDFFLFNLSFASPLKLFPTESEIGVVTADYTLDQGLRNGAFIWFIFLTISFPLFIQFKRNLEKIESLNTENAKSNAIARTTQMLAHDVRKPFALFKLTMERVNSAGTTEQVQMALRESLPEVERSMANVDGLITDVLNVGGEFRLVLRPIRLAQIVDDVIEEIRKLYPSRSLKIESKIPPEFWVQADITRLPRVFMNIMSNAIEAVGTQNVKLWVYARTLANNDVEIRVGNEGSFIAPEARERIFDLFFTSGKSGGTGLGLAIVKKIVVQHGGTVLCRSEKNKSFPEGKVEFLIELKSAYPADDSLNQRDSVLGIREESRVTIASTDSLAANTPHDPADTSAEKPLVVFLDDSPLVRWVWEAKLKTHVDVRCFDGPDSFFQALRSEPSQETSQQTSQMTLGKIHTIITDHYFAPDARMTGIELGAELRRMGFTGRILLASNGEFSPHELKGIVDKVVDKQPVGWDHLGM
ncbi:sensor histidine kinase [bacterium]|nr:sensor histidine kinase [bacterium]